MTEETPVLTADLPLQEVAQPFRRIAPLAWIVSIAIHFVAVVGFFEEVHRRPPDGPPPIFVDLVLDVPIRHVPPSSVLPDPAIPVRPETAAATPLPPDPLRLIGPQPGLVPVLPDSIAPSAEPTNLPAPIAAAPDPSSDKPPPTLPWPDSVRLSPDRDLVPPQPNTFADATVQPVPPATSAIESADPRPAASVLLVDDSTVPNHASTNSEPGAAPPVPLIASAAQNPVLEPPTIRPTEVGPTEAGPLQASPLPGSNVAAVVPRQADAVPVPPAPPPGSPQEIPNLDPLGPVAAVPPSQDSDAPGPTVRDELAPSRENPRRIDGASPVALEPERADEPRSALTAESASAPRAALSRALLEVQCGRVKVAVDADGSLHLTGHVRTAADRERLSAQVSTIAGERRVRSDLHLVGEPYCRVFAFLGGPELTLSSEQRQNLDAVAQSVQSGVLVLKAGMPLALLLKGPDFPSYAYVDYFTGDGQVYHVFPNADADHGRLGASERLEIGGRNGRGLKATIGPPFGLDLVVALASEVPLHLNRRPRAEAADTYLAALDGVIAQARRQDPSLRIEYTYYLIRTAPD
jgi:hypothetical protein